VGTIETADGSFDILVERLDRAAGGPIWLFASETLKFIPELYDDVEGMTLQDVLPALLVDTKILSIPLFEWLAVLVGLPVLYFLGVLLNRLLSPLAAKILTRLYKQSGLRNPEFLPPPVRLLAMALIIRWTLSKVDLPLLARQFWSSLAYVITLSACVWLLISLNGWVERRLRVRLELSQRTGARSLLGFARRTADLLVVLLGILIGVYYFGLNPTAAIAGLGVGGIAVALAAQKTLENIIGGISLIFDKSVQMGQFLQVGGTLGMVEDIGLRSTRIRTLDRTVVSVPNGQLAILTVENLSSRDKFWLHSRLNIRFETTSSQMRSVLAGISQLLADNHIVEPESVRVNLLSFGASSLEVEIFAYLFADNVPHFLKLQGELLLQIMEIVDAAGAQIALPSQTMYFADPLERAGVPQVQAKITNRN
jgi:MscS family membrane protein